MPVHNYNVHSVLKAWIDHIHLRVVEPSRCLDNRWQGAASRSSLRAVRMSDLGFPILLPGSDHKLSLQSPRLFELYDGRDRF